MDSIYLDNNSTTIIDQEVAAAIAECHRQQFVNPSSQHQPGQRARRRLEQLRSQILDNLGGNPSGMAADQLIFTSGGTESNNLALIGLAFEPDGSLPDRRKILVSSIEHPSLIAASQFLDRKGFSVEKIPVDYSGVVDLDRFENLLDQSVRIVSVMLVNNETGVIQPVEEISARCRQMGVICHSDAVQGVGKIPVDFSQLGVDGLSFTGHKLHGPHGIGGLILKSGIKPYPLLFGGFQQQGIRPGTEDVCQVTGLAVAIEKFAGNSVSTAGSTVAALRNRLQQYILDHCEIATIVGRDAPRVPHTLNVAFNKIDRQQFLMAADIQNLAISTGSACASGSSEPSPVLLAMGIEPTLVEGSIRISLSVQTTGREIDQAGARIIKIANDLRR